MAPYNHQTITIPSPWSPPNEKEGPSMEWRKSPSWVRRFLFVSFVLTVGSLGWRHRERIADHSSRVLKEATRPTSGRQLVVRVGGLSDEGIGSVVQHFKDSILLAHYLDRDLMLGEQQSEHKYQLSDVFNKAAIESGATIHSPICTLQSRWIGQERVEHLNRNACENPEKEEKKVREEYAKMFAGCGTIMHIVDKVPTEERQNGCIAPWLKKAMIGPVCGRRGPTRVHRGSGALSVGIHMRWGDVAPTDSSDILHHDRAIKFHEINDVVASLLACGRPLSIRVYAEDFPEEKRKNFEFEHDLVDTGDDIADLCDLADNEVILDGGSSYSTLAFTMSEAKLAIVSDQGFYKYDGLSKPEEGRRAIDLNTWSNSNVCEYLP